MPSIHLYESRYAFLTLEIFGTSQIFLFYPKKILQSFILTLSIDPFEWRSKNFILPVIYLQKMFWNFI